MSRILTGHGSGPSSVAAADVNEDGRIDIVVVNTEVNTVGILFGDGNGRFAATQVYNTDNAPRPSSVTVTDMNRDRYLDILVTNPDTSNMAVLWGDSNSTFSDISYLSIGFGSNPSSLAVADLNNDQQPDVILANWNNNNLSVFFGIHG